MQLHRSFNICRSNNSTLLQLCAQMLASVCLISTLTSFPARGTSEISGDVQSYSETSVQPQSTADTRAGLQQPMTMADARHLAGITGLGASPKEFPSLHALLGMDLFSPPEVAGLNEGAAYVVPGRLLIRQLALQTLLSVQETASLGGQNVMMSTLETENRMDSSSSMVASADPKTHLPLQVRLAGHFFRGPPLHKVSLHRISDQLLWTSKTRALEIGHDTETVGSMTDMSQLAWQTSQYSPPADVLSKSARVKIAFLNDAADKTRDRNLFVESVSINGETLSTTGAQQESNYPPENPHHAGRLYCAGTVAALAWVQGLGYPKPNRSHFASLLCGNQEVMAIEQAGPAAKKLSGGAVGVQLSQVLQNIQAGVDTPAYRVQLDGFDTHDHQLSRHAELLKRLSKAINGFAGALQSDGEWSYTLVMIYSEFGRCAAENQSGGTDHGTAAPHLITGGQIRGSLYGSAPDHSLLTDGDPAHTLDCRCVYEWVIGDWFKIENNQFGDFSAPQLQGLMI